MSREAHRHDGRGHSLPFDGRAMPDIYVLSLAACMLLGAALYASVGHAGASAYIALMALFGVAPAAMRPTALALNILVAGFTSIRYIGAGLFRWRVLWPFALGAIPFAFLGGSIQLPGAYYRPLVGTVLLLSAARLLWPRELKSNTSSPRSADMGWHPLWRRHWLSVRPYWYGRWHIPFTPVAFSRLVRNARCVWRRRRVHPLQFNCRLPGQRCYRERIAA